MTQAEANERDARRYHMLRALICAGEVRQREVHALIAPVLPADGKLDGPSIDRAMDLATNHYKIV